MSRLIDADKLMMSLNDNFLANSPTGNETLQVKDYRESVCEGLEIAMATVEEAPTVGGWISVKDRLPEKGGLYLSLIMLNRKLNYQITLWSGKHWYWGHDVCYWMPLQEMPKEEE